MSDTNIQTLTRAVAADPADADAADRLAVALVRAGRGPAFVEFITPPEGRYGNWDGPRFGRYRFSIQAGSGQYCSPRRDGLDAAQYTEWELAIVDTSPNGGLLHVLDVEEFQGMPAADHWESEGAVGPYVASEDVQAIFDWLTLAFGRPQHPSGVVEVVEVVEPVDPSVARFLLLDLD